MKIEIPERNGSILISEIYSIYKFISYNYKKQLRWTVLGKICILLSEENKVYLYLVDNIKIIRQ